MDSLMELIALLEKRAQQIRSLEERADKVIQEQGDQEGYERIMREKATLLAELYEDTRALSHGFDDMVDARLERFSQSAFSSLKVGSVFFMSALLYPEDHKPGDLNDLERFIETLRGMKV
ncbi:hypothetical protein [Salidesulfovibrio onnuriiensis]|uniref:hypothetical protein n=1 Tax=Salidesulfovibrio onnuriiensis TaxID=2583823 RepID=UPI0011CBD3CD|nr:hypothetical protein [Salidesulfovibrio onnuriiensis]